MEEAASEVICISDHKCTLLHRKDSRNSEAPPPRVANAKIQTCKGPPAQRFLMAWEVEAVLSSQERASTFKEIQKFSKWTSAESTVFPTSTE